MTPGERGNRPLRIAAEIRRELPELIRRYTTIPAGLLVSITDVEVTADLSQARIFFSVIGEHESVVARIVERELNRKRGALRTQLAQLIVMRQHPELKFLYDETPARAARIESLLNQIHKENRSPETGEDE